MHTQVKIINVNLEGLMASMNHFNSGRWLRRQHTMAITHGIYMPYMASTVVYSMPLQRAPNGAEIIVNNDKKK